MIEIKRNNEVIFSTPINEGCLRRCTLMQEDYVTLKFNLTTPTYLKLGDSIMNGAFEIVDLTTPTYNENTGAYEYEVRFDAYYWKWKNKKFFYSPEHGAREAVWNLTADLPSQLKVFLRNLKHLGYNYNGKEFEFVVEGVDNKSISMHYDSVNLIDALTMLAEAWECEWWITDNIIHFGRCEYGTPVDFKLNDNVQSMVRNDGQQSFATRIYAFGSARNIPRDYRPHSDEVAINGIADKRLMMPEGTPFVDAYPNMKQEEAVEQVVIFDDIYPSRTNEITEVREKEGSTTEEGVTTNFWTYWIKDESLEFKDEYILPNEELRITFQSGALNGMDFALGFHEKSNEFEIIRNEDYGRLLPDNVLKPKAGDKFILYGYDTKFIDDQLLPEAEQRLKERAIEYIEKIKVDPSTYENRMMSDFMFNKGEVRTFELGDKVNLINPTYFQEGRESRIIGYEYPLDKPYDSPIYYVGETASYSRLNELEDKVNELVYKEQIYQSTQGKGVYVIGQYDSTKATDRNVLSSLRSLNTFLRKDQPDKTEHLITFLKGLKIGAKYSINEVGNAVLNNIESSVIDSIQAKFHELESTKLKASEGTIDTLTALTLFVKNLADVEELNVKETATILNAVVKASLSSPKFTSGFLGEGFRINQKSSGDWNLEIDTLTVRKVFQVFELLIQEVKHQGGVVVHSPAGGKITKVTDGGSYWRCEIESADTFFKDDLVLCQQFTGKVKRYWRAVTSAGDGYINLSKTDCEANSAIPEVDDEIATLGNKTNTARQSAYLISVVGADAPYTAYYSGINSYFLKGKEHTRIGNLEGVVSPAFGSLKGHGAVLENAYVQGMIKLQNGKTVENVIDETSDKLSGDIGKAQTDLQKDINTSVSSVKNELGATITNVENNFNTSLNSTKNELNSSISKVQGDANAAKGLAQSAQDSIDGLEIGVRNLILNSSLLPLGAESTGIVRKEWNGFLGYSVDKINSNWASLYFPLSPQFNEPNVNYVFSVDIYYIGDNPIAPTFYTRTTRYRPLKGQLKNSTWVRVYQVLKPTSLDKFNPHFGFSGTSGEFYFRNFKLEKGNKPTDWTPAPEDIENQISEVKTEIKDVEQRFEIADGQINSHIKETTQLVTEAKLANGESIKTLEQVKVQINDINVTAGKINTTLGEVTKKQGEINSSISNLEQTAGSISASIDGFKETEAEIKATANRIEATHAGIVLEASEKSAQKAIDGLEIGGRNLWINTVFDNGEHWQNGGAEFLGGGNVRLNTGTITSWIQNDVFGYKVESDGVFVISFSFRTEIQSGNKLSFFVYKNGYSRVTSSLLSNDWSVVTKKISAVKGDVLGIALQVDGAASNKGVVFLKGVKLEKGNKPTDWSPAPEDIEDKIETTRTEFDSKLEITKEAITATSTKVDGLTGRVQETEAKLEPDRLWVAVKDNSQKLIDDLDTVNRNYAYVIKEPDDTTIYVSNDFPRNKKQYLSLSLWGNFEEFTNVDPFGEIVFGGRFDSPFFDYKYIRKSVNHIVYEGGYVDLSLETDKDLTLSLYGMAPEELITKAKIDLGTKATDWTPAPEELLTPEDIKASIELTTNGLNVFGKHHSFTGKVTFASLDSDAQGKINSAQSTADSANRDLGALKGSLGGLAYQDMVDISKLGSTIIEGGYLRTELIEAKSITAEKIDVDSLFAERIQTGNLDVSQGATIGGFEIGQGRIGNKVDNPAEEGFGNLAIYKDFFRVGGENGYAMLGDNVIPASAGGAFTAVGRIVNNTPNTGAQWGYDTANYGLFINVTGGTTNYGISSNAPLKAPAFINTRLKLLTLRGTGYKLDFSQHNIFSLYSNTDTNVTLPNKTEVEKMFGLSYLPHDFAYVFIVVARHGTKPITFKDVYNNNNEKMDLLMHEGDANIMMITSNLFRYQILTHYH